MSYHWQPIISLQGEVWDARVEQSQNGCGSTFRVVAEEIETGRKMIRQFRGREAKVRAISLGREIQGVT